MAAAADFRHRLTGRFPYPLGASIFFGQVAVGIVLFAIFQEYVPHELGTNDAWPGYLLTAYGAARFLSETPAGAFSDRVERKLGILVGFALSIPAVLAMALVHDEHLYLACAAFMGLGSAFVWPATYAIAADLYPPHRRGKIVGFLNVGQLLGFGVGALIGALVVERQPLLLFAVAIAGTSAAFVATLIGIPNYRGPGLFRLIHHQHRPSVLSTMSRQLAFLAGLIVAANVALAMLVPAIRPFGDEQLDVSFARLTVVMIPAIVIGAALYVPAGHASDRFGRVKPFFAGQVLLIAGLLVAATTRSLPVAGAAAVVIFAGNVLVVPAWNAAVMDLAPETHRGTLIGFSVALSGLGLALGPAIGGLLVQNAGAPAVFRTSAALCAATGTAIIFYGRIFRHAGQAQPSERA